MKRKVYFLICIALVMVLASSSTVFAVTTNKKIDIWAKYKPEITLTTVYGIQDDATEMPKDQSYTGKNPFSLAYKQDFGINLKVLWTTPANQYDQKVAIAIASNELPDIIKVNALQLSKIVNAGMAADLTQVYKDYISPWAKGFMEGDGGLGLTQATFGGKLMAIPQMLSSVDASPVLYIRYDWLQKLGLKPPKTTAEMRNIAKAFTTMDPDGNGKADTLGLGGSKDIFAGYGGFNGFFQSYGSYLAYSSGGANWIKDKSGKLLVPGEIQPETKRALADLASMYQKGYIDKEFGVKDGAKLAEDVAKGKIGMFYGNESNPFFPLNDSKKNDLKADWRAYPIPTVDGKPAKIQLSTGVRNFFVVRKGVKHPEAAIKILNHFLKRNPYWSPDHDPIYAQGSKDPKTGFADPNIKSPGWQFSVVNAFSPTSNIDQYKDYQIQYKTGTSANTKLSNRAKYNDFAKLIQLRIDTMIKRNEIPYDEPATFSVRDDAGVAGPVQVFRPAKWASNLWALAPWGPWAVITGYMDNKQMVNPDFYGTPTPTMASKLPTLDKLRVETFTKIITGGTRISEFDKFVTSFNKLGGATIQKEVNAWAAKNK